MEDEDGLEDCAEAVHGDADQSVHLEYVYWLQGISPPPVDLGRHQAVDGGQAAEHHHAGQEKRLVCGEIHPQTEGAEGTFQLYR